MTMEPGSLTTKLDVLSRLLDLGVVQVTLDARIKDVDVPEHLRGNSQLRLNLSHRYGLPLTLDDWGVRATLTFRGERYACAWPWRSLYAVVPHVGGPPFVFPDDIPVDLLSEEYVPEEATAGQITNARKPPPRLRLVESQNEPDSSRAQAPPPEKPPTRRAPHLRVVK
jgi:stringent starvation protein B